MTTLAFDEQDIRHAALFLAEQLILKAQRSKTLKTEFTVKIEGIELCAGRQEDVFSESLIEQVTAYKFSMTGGLRMELSIETIDEDGEPGAIHGFALIARRTEPVVAEPNSDYECSLPEFMEFRAFNPSDRGISWPVSFVNALIASNLGRLPEGWLAAAMEHVEQTGSGH